MAILFPARGVCRFSTRGEARFAERLEKKLEDDYLCWHDVPVGPANAHPDFVVLHPRRGLLVLEIKDWRLDNIKSITKHDVSLLTNAGLKHKPNPLEQARQYTHAVVNALEKDPQLTFQSGKLQGRLLFPWTYGVVLTNVTRKQFESTDLGEVLEPRRVLCQDEMTETADAEEFQRRLWEMFPIPFKGMLSLPQIDRIRWHLFPEIRLPNLQGGLFDSSESAPADPDEIPDLLRVMDLQQEQLARSLGSGHRVIHGVAGSGKTLILAYRAEQLARTCAKPILVLCYNRTLAKRLARTMDEKGLAEKVTVHTFHQWCRAQLVAYNVGLPPEKDGDHDAFFPAMVERVMCAVDRDLIPSAQYDAVLIDEGHDFEPHWFKLVVQMVDPQTNSLLVLYDDAQSIYGRERKSKFSFRSVGIQAQGRTTILRVNYRNTKEVLDLASRFARDLLKAEEADEDSVPLVAPLSAGRHGPEPLIIKLPTHRDEAEYIVGHLKEAHDQGTPWCDMAVIYHDYQKVGKDVLSTLRACGVPVTFHKDATFAQDENTVKFLTMHSCKGLEFPLVAIPGVEVMANEGKTDDETARLLYVAMTRSTRELILTTTDRANTITDSMTKTH